jgi:hypothetical protein
VNERRRWGRSEVISFGTFFVLAGWIYWASTHAARWDDTIIRVDKVEINQSKDHDAINRVETKVDLLLEHEGIHYRSDDQ